MKNVIIAVVITAIVSVAGTLTAVHFVRTNGGSSVNDAKSCRDALVEIKVLCDSTPRNEAEPWVDRLLGDPTFYRCGDPRWHDGRDYERCFASHERAKQMRTELDAWWSAHPERPLGEEPYQRY